MHANIQTDSMHNYPDVRSHVGNMPESKEKLRDLRIIRQHCIHVLSLPRGMQASVGRLVNKSVRTLLAMCTEDEAKQLYLGCPVWMDYGTVKRVTFTELGDTPETQPASVAASSSSSAVEFRAGLASDAPVPAAPLARKRIKDRAFDLYAQQKREFFKDKVRSTNPRPLTWSRMTFAAIVKQIAWSSWRGLTPEQQQIYVARAAASTPSRKRCRESGKFFKASTTDADDVPILNLVPPQKKRRLGCQREQAALGGCLAEVCQEIVAAVPKHSSWAMASKLIVTEASKRAAIPKRKAKRFSWLHLEAKVGH